LSHSSIALNFDLKQAVTSNRLKGLWRLMTGFRLKYVGATISLGVSAVAKTCTYLLLRYFVDNYFVGDAPVALYPVWMIAAGFVVLAFVEGGFTFISGRLAAQTAEGTTRRLRNYLFDHIQHLPFFYHKRMETGELIQRCTSDVDALRRFFADQAIGVGRIVLMFAINLYAIMHLNMRLGLMSVIVVPAVFAVSIFFFRRVSKAYEAYQEQDATLSTTLQENLSGVRVVKAFARQQYEMTNSSAPTGKVQARQAFAAACIQSSGRV
jgi:ATP-binding cassette, subfamily B, bacterial